MQATQANHKQIQRLTQAILLTLSILVLTFSQAQAPLADLLGKSTGSEERLLYKKPTGPYEITIKGERLLERAYFNLDIRQNGQPIPENSQVTLTINPAESAQSQTSSYTATYQNGQFIVNPINLNANADWGDDTWNATITVNSNAGTASTSFGFQVYAPKPAQSLPFSAINIALPIIAVALFLSIYALKGTKLEQTSYA